MRLPTANFVYCSDNKNFPYGPRPESQVEAFVTEVCANLVQRFNPDLLVIACNTASTVALPAVRSILQIPVVGVVPAIKPAAALTKTRAIGLLATPGTVNRAYTGQLIAEFAVGIRVVLVGSSKLVTIAEAKGHGVPVDLAEIKREIMPMFAPQVEPIVDTVVLGCTHFPILADELRMVAPWPVTWIDSGDAIAARVVAILPKKLHGFSSPNISKQSEVSNRIAVVTQLDHGAKNTAPMLAHYGFVGPIQL